MILWRVNVTYGSQNTVTIYPNIDALLNDIYHLGVINMCSWTSIFHIKPIRNLFKKLPRKDKLNGLALLNVHFKTEIKLEEVLHVLEKQPWEIIL